MLDFPHQAIAHQFPQAYEILAEVAFNPAFAWVEQLDKSEILSLTLAEVQIEEMSRMEENWDGYGALPISASTKYNALASIRGILLHSSTPEMTPNSNGTISFEWVTGRGRAHLEIGQTRLSFYIKPSVGEPTFIDSSATDILLDSNKIGRLVSASLYPLHFGTTSVTKVSVGSYVPTAY